MTAPVTEWKMEPKQNRLSLCCEPSHMKCLTLCQSVVSQPGQKICRLLLQFPVAHLCCLFWARERRIEKTKPKSVSLSLFCVQSHLQRFSQALQRCAFILLLLLTALLLGAVVCAVGWVGSQRFHPRLDDHNRLQSLTCATQLDVAAMDVPLGNSKLEHNILTYNHFTSVQIFFL